MKLHEIAAEGRAIADRMCRAHRTGEVRDQGAVGCLSEYAGEIRALMNRLVRSDHARMAELRQGEPTRPTLRGGTVTTESGRVITAETLFRTP